MPSNSLASSSAKAGAIFGQGQALVPLDQPAFARQASNQFIEHRSIHPERATQFVPGETGAFRRPVVEVADQIQNLLLDLGRRIPVEIVLRGQANDCLPAD